MAITWSYSCLRYDASHTRGLGRQAKYLAANERRYVGFVARQRVQLGTSQSPLHRRLSAFIRGKKPFFLIS
jgi:hypothetical protein